MGSVRNQISIRISAIVSALRPSALLGTARQSLPRSAPYARLQYRQLHADRGDADPIRDWSLTSLKEKPIKIGAEVVRQGRYVTFEMAEVAVSRQLFQEILSLIARLRAPPALA